MIPHERRVVTTAQYRTETGLSIAEINRLIKERGVHDYGTHAKVRLYDHEQLEAARAGAPALPEIAEAHELDKLTIADIAALAGQPPNTWTVYHRRQIGPMKGRKPDWVEPKKEAVKADGTKRDPVEYWYRETATAIIEGINPIGWVKGRPRPSSKGRPPAPELEDVVTLLRTTPTMTGKQIAERLGLNERKALRLRSQALTKLEAERLEGGTKRKSKRPGPA